MSVEVRRDMLVRYLREHGRTSVNDLASHFNITGATVRSDLRHLELANLVTRRYGGAEAVTHPVAEDRSMDEKTTLNQNIKQRIGAKAASLVNDGGSIILDNGSTTLQMVPWLIERVALTVMTNSLLIINEAVARDCNMNLLMPGALTGNAHPRFMADWLNRHFDHLPSISCLSGLMVSISNRGRQLSMKPIR